MNKAKLSDLQKIYNIFMLYKEIFPHIRKDYLQREINREKVIFENDTALVFGVYKRKQRLGIKAYAQKGDTIIHQIVTAYQGTGNAKKLLNSFLKDIQNDVYIAVRSSNTRAIRFYFKANFEIVSSVYWKNNSIKGYILKLNKNPNREERMAKKVIKKQDVKSAVDKGGRQANNNKPTAKKNKVDKKDKGGKKSNSLRSVVREYCADLMLQRKFTDKQMVDMANKKFPEYQIKAGFVSGSRWNLNRGGRGLTKPKTPVVHMIELDGKVVPYTDKPKSKSKPKYTEENDPLKKIAGINVHHKKPKAIKKS